MQTFEEHKEWVADVFDKVSEDYGAQFFSYFGNKWAQETLLPDNPRILDVATGKGAVLLPLAERLKKEKNLQKGELKGIDLSPNMIAHLQKIMEKEKVQGVQVLCMDAESLTFPSHYFDVVFCHFALPFFSHLEKGLQEIKRVLKPGGMFYPAIIYERPDIQVACLKHMRSVIGDLKNILRWSEESPLPDFKEVMAKVGFQEEFIDIHSYTVYFPDFDKWWKLMHSHGYRGYFDQLSLEESEEVKRRTKQDYEKKSSLPFTTKVLHAGLKNP